MLVVILFFGQYAAAKIQVTDVEIGRIFKICVNCFHCIFLLNLRLEVIGNLCFIEL